MNKREPNPPSRWGKSSPLGVYFEVCRLSKRDDRGRKCYRLRYLAYGNKTRTIWTLDDLTAAGVRWLKNKPSAAKVRAQR